MDEIEIILIDDASTDNSTDIIKQLMIDDKRIKIIINKKNRGILYSRSIGVQNAKGKYIMTLDNDDLFLYGIFDICYEVAEKNNLDILEFSGIQICNNCSVDKDKIYIPYYLRFKENGLKIEQPNLSSFIYNKFNGTYSYDFKDVFIWGKIIRANLYKKVLKLLGKEIMKYKIYITEDKIITYGLFKVATSFKFIDIYGIIYIENPFSICNSWVKNNRKRIMIDFLLFAIIFFKLTKDSEEVQIVMEDLKIRFNEYCQVLDYNYIKLLIKLYKELLKCKYINAYDKLKLIDLINNNKNNLKKI